MRHRAVSFLLLAAAMSVLQAPAWSQCVMCGTALASSPESAGLAEGFRSGILLLMAIPYVMLGTVGFVVFRAYRKKIKNELSSREAAQ